MEDKPKTSLIENMFDAGVHYGYSHSRRHPSFASLIFGTKNGSDVIDLEKTSIYLTKATDFIRESAVNNKTILFVGTKPEIRKIMEVAALSLPVPYMTNRWIGGLITNFSEMKKRVKKLEEWNLKKEKNELDVYTKKERMIIDDEITDLTRNFGGIVSMARIPDVMFIIDPRHEETAVLEARKKNIPIVAIIGTDSDITKIDYPIPANDATIRSVSFFVNKVVEAYKEGVKNQKPEPQVEQKTSEVKDKEKKVI